MSAIPFRPDEQVAALMDESADLLDQASDRLETAVRLMRGWSDMNGEEAKLMLSMNDLQSNLARSMLALKLTPLLLKRHK